MQKKGKTRVAVLIVKSICFGAREVVPWLRVLNAFVEDLHSVPSIYVVTHNSQ